MSEEVIVTRRSDGARFRIVMQARSTDGPVTLERIAAPCDRLEVRGSEFVRNYYDPRKGSPMCERCRADKVQHPALGQRFVCLACERVQSAEPAQNALDASDIPTWADLMAERREKARARTAEDAAKILDAVRATFRAVRDGCQGDPCGPLSLGTMSASAVQLANEKLAPRGWRVKFDASRDRLVLEAVKPPAPEPLRVQFPETAATDGGPSW